MVSVKFGQVLSKICSNFEIIKEPRAKAAAIWILGEYCELIEGVEVLMDTYLDNFHDGTAIAGGLVIKGALKKQKFGINSKSFGNSHVLHM